MPAPPDADASQPDPSALIAPPACKCEPTPEKYCKVIDLACRADADCPRNFTCTQSATGTATGPACFVAPGGGDAGTCGPLPQPPPPVYRCVPPFQSLDVDVAGGFKREDVPVTMHPSTQPGANPTTPPPVGTPRPGTNPDAGVATGQPVPGQAAGTAAPQAPAGPKHVKSCAVTTPGATGGPATLWVALVALTSLSIARRRNRRAR